MMAYYKQKWQMDDGGVNKKIWVGSAPRIYPYLLTTQLKDRKLQVERSTDRRPSEVDALEFGRGFGLGAKQKYY